MESTGMDYQWSAMVIVGLHRYSYTHDGIDPAFQCEHCRKTITLLGCAFTANDWGPDIAHPVCTAGALTCPRCGKDAARAYHRFALKVPGQPRSGVRGVDFDTEEEAENEEDGC